MNFLEKLKYRRIKFDGWQMPLKQWRQYSSAKVSEGTEYIGSFGIMYKGKSTGKYIDVHIINKSGYIEVVVR